VLTVRQSIGNALLHKTQQAEVKLEAIKRLDYILLHFLPKGEDEIWSHVEDIIDDAVSLANSLSTELAWFRWEIEYVGQDFDPRRMMLVDDGQTGMVQLCIFPSLARWINDPETGKGIWQYVSQGTVELESAFA